MILRTAHVPFAKPLPGERMSYEEFLDRVFDHPHYEWVDGEAVEMAEVDVSHERLCQWLRMTTGVLVNYRPIGEVLGEPYQMKTGPDLPGRCPDVMFVSTARASIIDRKCLRGPADLVIEVTSPSRRRTDRGAKFREYATGGVPEYWMLDPFRKVPEFFLVENGVYVPAELEEDGSYRCPALGGVAFRPEWFWTLAPLPEVLKAWQLI